MIYEDDEVIDDGGQEQEVVSSRDSGMATVALAVLAGAAIGAAVALMLAPRSGRDLRRVIRKSAQGLRQSAEGLRQSASGVLDDAGEELQRQMRRRSRQVRRQMDRMA